MEKKNVVANPWTGQGDAREFPGTHKSHEYKYISLPVSDKKLIRILQEITDEFLKASKNYGAFTNAHEGYAVLLEEVDELWDEVKKRPDIRNDDKLRHEATQIAAMAIRFIYDTIEKNEND